MSRIGTTSAPPSPVTGTFPGNIGATVEITPFPEGKTPTSSVVVNNPTWIYIDYFIESSYEEMPHVYMGGVTSPDGFNDNSAAFFQLAATTKTWVCRWTALRMNAKPEVPIKTSNTNWVYLGGMIAPYMVNTLVNGYSSLWRISGVYYYGAKKPGDNIWDNASFGLPPFLEQGIFKRSVSSAMFVDDLADEPPAPSQSDPIPPQKATTDHASTTPGEVQQNIAAQNDIAAGITPPISINIKKL